MVVSCAGGAVVLFCVAFGGACHDCGGAFGVGDSGAGQGGFADGAPGASAAACGELWDYACVCLGECGGCAGFQPAFRRGDGFGVVGDISGVVCGEAFGDFPV